MPNLLGLFYVIFLTLQLYTRWGQFIIVQFTLPTPPHWVTSIIFRVFKSLHLNLLNIVTLLDLKVVIGYHPTILKTIYTIFKFKLLKSTLKETGIFLSQLDVTYLKKYLSAYSSEICSCLYFQAKRNGKKRTHGGSPKNLPDLEDPWPIFLLTKATKIPRVTTIDVSKFSLGFILQMYFEFFNVESIRGFTSIFLDICPANSQPFGFPYRIKLQHLDILKFLFTSLINQYNKFVFIRVDEYGSLAISSVFINKFHSMNIIFQTTGGYLSSIHG